MITLISPSKTQDFSDTTNFSDYTEPHFLNESARLIKELKKKSVKKIGDLMEVSEKIAELNYHRYQNFNIPFSPDNARQALLAFRGDVYTDIEIDSYSKKDFEFAQEHLRILSGLYGLLRPLDLIQPYRLEMKIKLKNSRGKNLYEFWGDRITKALNEALLKQKSQYVVNLASNEYFKAINPKNLKGKIITPVFKENHNGTYKIIAIYAKRARGMMSNFIIRNKIDAVEKLKTFQEAGYEYSEPMSTENEWAFIR